MEHRKYPPRANADIREENSGPMNTIVDESDLDCLINRTNVHMDTSLRDERNKNTVSIDSWIINPPVGCQ